MAAISSALSGLSGGGASLIGGLGSYLGAGKQKEAADDARDMAAEIQRNQTEYHDLAYVDQMNLQRPNYDQGMQAQARLADLLGMGPGGQAGRADFARDYFQNDPGYQFRLSEGLKALDRTSAARGKLISGTALRGAQRFGQDLASQEYGNAYNRYMQPLQSMIGRGDQAGQLMGQYAGNRASNISNSLGGYASAAGNYMLQSGNANAAGIVGLTNGVTGAASSAGQNKQDQDLMNVYGSGYGSGSNNYRNYNSGMA